jgi:hypothetical protein
MIYKRELEGLTLAELERISMQIYCETGRGCFVVAEKQAYSAIYGEIEAMLRDPGVMYGNLFSLSIAMPWGPMEILLMPRDGTKWAIIQELH